MPNEPSHPQRAMSQEAPELLIPVSVGDLIDRITILEIKRERIGGEAGTPVQRELQWLRVVLERSGLQVDPELRDQLRAINLRLWQIEDEIREQERLADFGERFIALARSVYRHNDQRAALKRQLNERHGSPLIEVKSYSPY